MIFTFVRVPVSGADYAFDCIGIKQTMEQILPACSGHFGAQEAAKRSGERSDNPAEIAVDYWSTKSVHRQHWRLLALIKISRFLEWEDNGDLGLEMVAERFSIDQINEATDALANGKIAGRAI